MRGAPGAVADRRLGAAAGVAYALLAAIENLDVLEAPRLGAPVADIAAAYAGGTAKLAIQAGAGALSLVAYVLAAVTVWSVVRRGSEAWSTVALAGAVLGPALGATALAAHGALVVGAGDGGLPGDVVRLAHDLRAGLQALAGLPQGLFLVGVAVSGWRGGGIPRWLAGAAGVVGAGCLALGVGGPVLVEAARGLGVVVLGLHAGWLLVASVWLLLADWPPARDDSAWLTLSRVLAGTVAVAAGVSGAALVAFPAATADFFSWGLGPPPLAALIGGFYLASAVVYGRVAVAPWAELRVAMVGIVALTLPILWATSTHLDVFDFDRLQAWAWVVLFAAFPVAAASALVGEGLAAPRGGPLAPGLRLLAAVVAALLALASLLLWASPVEAGADLLPFTPSPLGGRVLGGWTFLLATLAGWLAAGGRQVRVAALAHAAFPLGALVAALRTFDRLRPPADRAAYLLVLVAWAGAGAVLVASHRRAGVKPR